MKQLAAALIKAGLSSPNEPASTVSYDDGIRAARRREQRDDLVYRSRYSEHSKRANRGRYGYLYGQYALDVATLAGLHVQSLSYPLGKSPLLFPWALRYSPDDAYIDLDRLKWWDAWAVAWARIGAHYFQSKCTEEE